MSSSTIPAPRAVAVEPSAAQSNRGSALVRAIDVAVLLVLAQAPYDLSPLAFVALVPFAWLAAMDDAARPFRAAYLAGLLHFGGGCFWLRHTHPLNLVMMTLIEALAFPLALLLLRRLRDLRIPQVAALPLAWVAVEWTRASFPFNGFPWLLLGNALARPLEWAQNADLLGPLGLSFFAALTSGAFACAFPRAGGAARSSPSSSRRLAWLAFALAIPFALFLRGRAQLEAFPAAARGELGRGPTLALIQANIPQELKQETKKSGGGKGDAEKDAQKESLSIIDRHLKLTERAVREGKVDLVVWPETMIPGWFKHTAKDEIETRFLESNLFGPMLRQARTQLLLGILTTDAERIFASDTFNTAVLYSPDGERLARYSKTVLVPGGEFIPMRSWLKGVIDPIVLSIAPVVPSLTAGDGPVAMHLDALATGAAASTFGVTICYENVYSDYVRGVANLGVDFIVNLSNEGWFKASAEFDQMEAVSKLRAIETRRPLVRATNTGISAQYDWAGRTREKLEDDSKPTDSDREIEGVLRVQVPNQKGSSPYLSLGDAPVRFLSIATWILFGLAWGLRRYRSPRSA